VSPVLELQDDVVAGGVPLVLQNAGELRDRFTFLLKNKIAFFKFINLKI
jgi:hypothetical protein